MREKELEETKRSLEAFGQNLTGFLQDWANNGRADWKRLLINMAEDWRGTLKSMAEIWSAMKGAFSAGGGGLGGILSAAAKGLGTMFGGARAMGGDVTAGRAYRVGENGPEWFVPGANGGIVPNGGGGGKSITVIVNAQDAVLAETVKGWVKGAVEYADTAARTAFEAARVTVPTDQAKAAVGSFI